MFKMNPQGTVVGLILRLTGKLVTINSQSIRVYRRNQAGYIMECEGASTVTGGGAGYAVGCEFTLTTNGAKYVNTGDATSCTFTLVGTVTAGSVSATELATDAVETDKILDGAVTPAKLAGSEAITATADGTGTGAMSGAASHAAVTSGAATDQVSLPASSAALIGRQFTLWVGANGFELITPAASNATINGTDADGTNQADIPANSLSRVTLVAANTWLLENIGSTGTVASPIIPDND